MNNKQGLTELIAFLDAIQISFWIDSGTLLGMYRNKSLIAWDNDIDIGVWGKDIQTILDNKAIMTGKGYTFSIRKYRGKIYGMTLKSIQYPELLPLHIHVYFQEGDFAWSPQTVIYSCEATEVPDWIINNPSHARSFLNWCKVSAKKARDDKSCTLREKMIGFLFCYPIWGSLYVFKRKLNREQWASIWPLSLYYRTYTWIVPAEIFKSISFLQIDGLEIPIPEQTERYLTLRYGEWKQPVQQWYYWKDDGCIVPFPPEKIQHELQNYCKE